MTRFTESVVEDAALALLSQLGYTVVHGGDIEPKTPNVERDHLDSSPLILIKLKNPTSENAILHNVFSQFQNYRQTVSNLFLYNKLLIMSDGLEARLYPLASYAELIAKDWAE